MKARYGYLIPRVGTIQPGYALSLNLPMSYLTGQIAVAAPVKLTVTFRVYFEGQELQRDETTVEYSRDLGWSQAELNFRFAGIEPQGDKIGFYQIDAAAAGGEPVFNDATFNSAYGIYTRPGAKPFIAELADKFSDPRVILQMRRYGMYIQTYPVVRLDRARDYGESVSVLNPYRQPLLVSVRSSNGRQIERRKVPGASGINLRLIGLLREDEPAWVGSIQVTATNRVVPYMIKHSLAEPWRITDHEHLDWYQPTKVEFPRFLYFRRRMIGRLARMGLYGR